MWLRSTLAASAVLAAPAVAIAQPVSGLYVAGGVGVNLMPHETNKTDIRNNPFGSLTGEDFNFDSKRSFAAGFAGIGSVGYGLGNGLRIEAEGNYRRNDISGTALTEQKYGGMANLMFDLDVGLSYFYPYIGAGAGYVRANRISNDSWDGSFAYQGIAGAALPLPWVPGLSATMEYRFMGLDGDRQSHALASFPGGTVTQTTNNDLNHSLLVGLRYAFNAAPPLAPAGPTAVPAPAVVPARTYLVFFDWDRADLTDRARQIIAEAARNSTRVQTTRIEVQGNADRSGAPAYNQTLSLHRAQTVAAELVRHGVPHDQIDIQAFGDTRPLVATEPGVREPQNRRVEIILR
jgi:outer membrane protein OmpA-like peptidoglycan-associated protein